MPPFFSSSSQLHIHISAQDRPGILAETLAFIVQTGWNVVDIKQFVFNGLLNLSILLDGCDDRRILPLREALSAYAEKMDFKVTVYPWGTGLTISRCWPGLASESPSMPSPLCNVMHEPALTSLI